MTAAGTLTALGIALIFIGVIVIIVAIFLLSVSGGERKGKIRGGGVIMIGPIPIVFGTDRKALKTVLLLSLVLTVFAIVAMTIYYFLFR